MTGTILLAVCCVVFVVVVGLYIKDLIYPDDIEPFKIEDMRNGL